MTSKTLPLVLVDLDDTLFQSRRKCPPDVADSDLVLAAEAKGGNHSYMTPAQTVFVDWLISTSSIIPVTARSSSALKGVQIGFREGAIITNGLQIILRDGGPDPEWQSLMTAELTPHQDTLKALLAAGRRDAEAKGLDTRSLICGENGLLGYTIFKQNDGNGEALADIQFDGFDLTGWTRHHNANNLALLPPVLSKKRAVDYLIAKVRKSAPATPILGLGDSLSDVPFLQSCDWWGMPVGSQIATAIAEHLGGQHA